MEFNEITTWPELDGLSICCWDYETPGLWKDNIDRALCMSVKDMRTGKVIGSSDIDAMNDLIQDYDVHVGHNLIGFDFEVAKRLYDIDLSDKLVFDTLTMSKMFDKSRRSHSLKSWGTVTKDEKMDYVPAIDPDQPTYVENYVELRATKKGKQRPGPGWSGAVYTDFMQEYCDQDVASNGSLFTFFAKHMASLPFDTVQIEMETQKIISWQNRVGFAYDKQAGEVLEAKVYDEMQRLTRKLQSVFKPRAKLDKVIYAKETKSGKINGQPFRSWLSDYNDVIAKPEFDDEGNQISGVVSRFDYEPFNPGSRKQVVERLESQGYRFVHFTEPDKEHEFQGKTKVNFIYMSPYATKEERRAAWEEAVAKHVKKQGNRRGGRKELFKVKPLTCSTKSDSLQFAAERGFTDAALIDQYLTAQRVHGFLKRWNKEAVWHEDQGVWRIHGSVDPLGAATTRMTHSAPNLAQVPSPKKYLGKECRSLFVARPGYKIVGCDASGLELRCLAHYIDDAAYTYLVLEGDVHTHNQEAAGLDTRDDAKTFIYAFIYGAGNELLGALKGGGAREGKALKEQFLEANPKLRDLQEGVERLVKERGERSKAWPKTSYIDALDGRRVLVNPEKPYTSLNRLLQSMGAIVMKYWLVEVVKNAKAENIDFAPVANVHDEGQFEVRNDHAKRFAEICEAAFPTVSKNLDVRCLLEGKADIGDSWYETH